MEPYHFQARHCCGVILVCLLGCDPHTSHDRSFVGKADAETAPAAAPAPPPPAAGPAGLPARMQVDIERTLPIACLNRSTLITLLENMSSSVAMMDEMDRQGINDCIWIGSGADVLVVGESSVDVYGSTLGIVELRLPGGTTSIYTLRKNIQ